MKTVCKPPHHLRDAPLRSVQGRGRRTSLGVGFSGRGAVFVAASRPLYLFTPFEHGKFHPQSGQARRDVSSPRNLGQRLREQIRRRQTTFHKVSLHARTGRATSGRTLRVSAGTTCPSPQCSCRRHGNTSCRRKGRSRPTSRRNDSVDWNSWRAALTARPLPFGKHAA